MLPQRSSARLRGIKMDPENRSHETTLTNSDTPREPSIPIVRHGDLSLEDLVADTLGEEEKKRLKDSLSVNSEDKKPLSTPKTELEGLLRTMQLRSYTRVSQKRIYSMLYHPTLEKDLVFTGDQAGNLGVWNALADENESQGSEDIPAGSAFSLRMHGAAIGCLRMDPLSPERIYTSSYDSTLRVFSLKEQVSMEVWRSPSTVQLGEFDILCPLTNASEASTPGSHHLDGRSLWLADHTGALIHIDVRSSPSEYHRWQISDKKVGGLAVNAQTPHCIATASNDRNVRLFDTRMIQRCREMPMPSNKLLETDLEELNKLYAVSQLGSMERGMACTSVDFSPDGKYLGMYSLLRYSQRML